MFFPREGATANSSLAYFISFPQHHVAVIKNVSGPRVQTARVWVPAADLRCLWGAYQLC